MSPPEPRSFKKEPEAVPPHPSLLTPSLGLYAGVVAVLTFAAGAAYRWAWLRLRSPREGVTPTGLGALLGPVMLGTALISGATVELVASLAIVTIATAVYWIDDLAHLSARVRILVS